MSDEALVRTDNERHAQIRLLEQTLDNNRFPLAPRLDPLKAILAKFDPPAPKPEPLPPLPADAGHRRRRG